MIRKAFVFGDRVLVFAVEGGVEADEREGLIKESCAEDGDLQNEVLELLAGHEEAITEDFLGVPPWIVEEIPTIGKR